MIAHVLVSRLVRCFTFVALRIVRVRPRLVGSVLAAFHRVCRAVRKPHLVIHLLLIAAAQNVIGLRDLLESFFGLSPDVRRLLMSNIWVIFLC